MPNQTTSENKQKYLDEKGRTYVIERLACCAGLGRVSQNVHILYEDGTKAVIPFTAHSSHSKLEDDAQKSAKGAPSITDLCRGLQKTIRQNNPGLIDKAEHGEDPNIY